MYQSSGQDTNVKALTEGISYMNISPVCGTLEEPLSGRSVPFFAKEGTGNREKGRGKGELRLFYQKLFWVQWVWPCGFGFLVPLVPCASLP